MLMVERCKLRGLLAQLVFLLMFSTSLAESKTICTNKLKLAPLLREIKFGRCVAVMLSPPDTDAGASMSAKHA